jgi:PAS domain S-box-containing protein
MNMQEHDKYIQEVLDHMLEGCQIIDFDWRYIYLNDVVIEHARKDRGELLGRQMMEVYPGIEQTPLFDALKECMRSRTAKKLLNEFVYPDGSPAWFELTIQPVNEGLLITSLDITDYLNAQERVRKLNRVYAVLSDINQAIVRTRGLQPLFEKACRIAVEKGDFLLAYIGLLEEPNQRIRVAAYAGRSDSDLDKIIGFFKDNAVIEYPVGAALHQGEHVVYNLIEHVDRPAPYHGIALDLGCHSFGSFPLLVSGALRGIFNLYADTPDFFVEEELNLLDELAMDISFAMEVAEKEAARKQAEEEIRRLNAELEQRVRERTAELSDLYSNAPCGYHSLDGDGLFVRINETELGWLGYSREEIIGKMKFADLLTPASVRSFSENFPTFKARGWIRDLEFDMVRKDGSILPVLLSATAITDQQGRYLLSRSMIIDLTDRKRAEQAIRKSQAQLEAANKELEAFAYSVSHDLRAPLRAIDGFSRILAEDYQDRLDAEGLRLLGVVRTNTQKMDDLITDLLDLSRVTRNQMQFFRIDMTALASTVYQEIALPRTRQKFAFSVRSLPDAYGDVTLMRQVWSNLLANAIKYTLPKDERIIEVGGYREADVNVYYVKDSGVGFNQEYAHKLFGVFQRLHSADEFEGTGVGLAIVQRIIHRHGGSAWAEGKIDQGTTLYFSLPNMELEYGSTK